MKINNITKSACANILSVLGYPYALAFMYFLFIYSKADIKNPEYVIHPEMSGYYTAIFTGILVIAAIFVFIAFTALAIIELIIRKINKTEFTIINKIPDKFYPFYIFFFWLGIFLISPLFLFCLFNL